MVLGARLDETCVHLVNVGTDGGVVEMLLWVEVLLAAVGLAANLALVLCLEDLLPEVLELLFANAPILRVQTLSSKEEFRAGRVALLLLQAAGRLEEGALIGRNLGSS